MGRVSSHEGNFGATPDELVYATARAFGFAATSSLLREVITARISQLENGGTISNRNGLLVVAEQANPI